jgi:benzoyl-CoA 2,3-epoxidase subunit A
MTGCSVYAPLSIPTLSGICIAPDGRPISREVLCDCKVGEQIQVIEPLAATFLMPNHPHSNIVMICTGTGSAPMRAMTEWRRRLRSTSKFESGKLILFFGARTPEELPYFGPLMTLPGDFIDINLAFSRQADKAKKYVQDVMRERSSDLAVLLIDPNTHVYICGLKAMEEGVPLALRDIAEEHGTTWDSLGAELKNTGRLHLETY